MNSMELIDGATLFTQIAYYCNVARVYVMEVDCG